MEKELVNQLNWVDVFVFIVLIRVILISYKHGFVIEIFQLLGTIFSIFIAFHSYSSLAQFMSSHSPIPIDFTSFISFVALIALILVLFKFSRDAFLFVIKMQPLAVVDKWGSVVLGVIRAVYLSSIIIVALLISTIGYLQQSAQRSFSSRYFLDLAPKAYAFMFDNIYSKFSPTEEINSSIFKAIEKKQ
ncbi:MAG: CvpA family protein [Candidatus Omnitrophica bacterium]|nr:CvpA family protein [Candidatus Omnitrophota bacterium]